MVLPYVYKCTNRITGEYYFGYRCANKVPAEFDLGIKYFTSSKNVSENFHLFDYCIIAIFFEKEYAYTFEQELIRKHFKDSKNINKSCKENGKILKIRKFTEDEKLQHSIKAKQWHADINKNSKHRESLKKLGLIRKESGFYNGKNNNMYGTKWTEDRRKKCSNFGYVFWTNFETNTRSIECPGNEWVRGEINTINIMKKLKSKSYKFGLNIYVDLKKMIQFTSPLINDIKLDNRWILLDDIKNEYNIIYNIKGWWNNGIFNIRCILPPDNSFKRGRL